MERARVARRVWRRQRQPRAGRPNRREVEGHPASSQTQMSSVAVRQTSLEQKTAPVAMQLSDDRQSRDECLHGRTQLWASAARQLMSQKDAYVNRRHRRSRHVYTLDSNSKRESSGRSKIAECTLTVQEEAGECGEGEPVQSPTSFGPEESAQSDEETSEKLWNTFQQQFGKLYDAEG